MKVKAGGLEEGSQGGRCGDSQLLENIYNSTTHCMFSVSPRVLATTELARKLVNRGVSSKNDGVKIDVETLK